MNIFDFEECEINNIGNDNSWVTLYKKEDKKKPNVYGSIYSYLVKKDYNNEIMSSHLRDFNIGDGTPTYEESFDKGSSKFKYYPHDERIIPLVFFRKFPHLNKEGYWEISQELTGYLGLFHEEEKNRYVSADDNDDPIDVIVYSKDFIKIRKIFLDAYMCIRQANLIISFVMSEELDSRHDVDKLFSDDNRVYSMYSNSYNNDVTIVGKNSFNCMELNEKNITPESIREYLSYIVSGDEVDHKLHSCDPDIVSSSKEHTKSGLQIGFSPLFFKKEVLNKYLNNSKTYKVGDNTLEKVGYWILPIDNNHNDYVSIFLKDIGRYLSTKEQYHWKSYNVAPDKLSMSDTFEDRSLKGRWCNSEQPVFELKRIRESINSNWNDKFKFSLFKELNEKDKHCLDMLHPLLKNEQSEFDEQILFITKIFIDSLNESEIKKITKNTHDDKEKELRGIKLFQQFLLEQKLNIDLDVIFKIQGLRSSGSAHRKSKNYDTSEKRLDINNDDLEASYREVASKLLNCLSSLNALVEK